MFVAVAWNMDKNFSLIPRPSRYQQLVLLYNNYKGEV